MHNNKNSMYIHNMCMQCIHIHNMCIHNMHMHNMHMHMHMRQPGCRRVRTRGR